MTRTNTDIALEFLQQAASGTISDAILAPDFTGWTATFGDVTGDRMRQAIAIMTSILKEPLKITPIGITADGERVAIEAVSQGTLKNGENYSNDYHYLIVVKNGLVSQMKAYFNTLEATTRLTPHFNASSPTFIDSLSAADRN